MANSFWLTPDGTTFLKTAGGDLVYDDHCCCSPSAADCSNCDAGTTPLQVQITFPGDMSSVSCIALCATLAGATVTLNQNFPTDPSGCSWVVFVSDGSGCEYQINVEFDGTNIGVGIVSTGGGLTISNWEGPSGSANCRDATWLAGISLPLTRADVFSCASASNVIVNSV